MAQDATGTPTSLGIPTYNVDADAPAGDGLNAIVGIIDTLIAARIPVPGGKAAGDVPIWNGSSWVVPGGTRDGTKFLRDDGTWQSVSPSGLPTVITGIVNADGTIAGGTGFSVVAHGSGSYDITFTSAYAAAPVVIAQQFFGTLNISGIATTGVHITTQGAANGAFNFIAYQVS